MEAFVQQVCRRHLPPERTFRVHTFQGKPDLLARLPSRLLGYATWLPDDWRIVIVVDCDSDVCQELKNRLEEIVAEAGLSTRAAGATWQVVTRIAVEELEAWYFGDWYAVRAAFPRVPPPLPSREAYRDADAIRGGTWEAFERVMQRHGYFRGGLNKVEAARVIGAHIDPARSTSRSFLVFWRAIVEAVDK